MDVCQALTYESVFVHGILVGVYLDQMLGEF